MELTQAGKYTIVGKIGAGAMGEVFRAHDPVLGRDVAIKVVLGKLSEDEGARQRFQREARAAAQLNHPNIITVYDFGEERGMAYMAMELLEGTDLRELLAATSAIVPEDAVLEHTGEAPAPVSDEPDYDLIVALWNKAVNRVTPKQMEAELPADAFRIMRPLALWLEQGALRIAGPAAPGT